MKLLAPAVVSITLSVANLSASAMTNADYYGEAANAAAAVRTIVVGPNTRWVNVDQGEIVKIVANGQEFTWDFDGTLPTLNLKQIAPQGAVVKDVTVYIASSRAGASGG
jgi:heavy-metal resistance protein CzcE